MIQGHGNSNADIMIVADGGYPDCATTNYALSGFNERQIAQLAGNSFKVAETYRTLLIKEKISYTTREINSRKIPYYLNEETKAKIIGYQDILENEIETIKPNLIIPLGELSFKWLTGHESIRKYRGSCLPGSRGTHNGNEYRYKTLPTFGPHIWNTEYKQRWVTQLDFAKVPANRGPGPPNESSKNIWICRNYSSFKSFCDRHYNRDGYLNFDIETFCGIPTCISFCFDGIESISVPIIDKEIPFGERLLLLGGISRLLNSPIKKGNQNIKYDWKCLERFNFRINNVTDDTMLAASLLMPELPKNLGFLSSIYTDLPYFKGEGKQVEAVHRDKEKFYLYNAKDSLASWQIRDQQVKEINELGCREVYDNLIKLIPIYKQMEDNGLRIDDTQRLKLLAKYETLYNVEVIKINKLLNLVNFNPASTQQCKKIVYEELAYPTSKEANATGEDELEWLILFSQPKRSPIYGPIILQSIINCRKLHKVIEYLSTISYPDGKWRCEYNLAGAETGRSTAGVTTDNLITAKRTKKGIKFEFKELGRSFQTIVKHGFKINNELLGKEVRSIFIPSQGYNFVEIDQSQAEARVDAVLSGNYDILSIFDGPIGIHRLTGSWVYHCEPLEIKKDTPEYLMSKTVRHAAERNLKAAGLSVLFGCELAEANRVLGIVHDKQPEIKETFHKDVRRAIDTTRTLVSPNGRRRQFLDRISDRLYNEAISQLPQSIVSDQNKFSLIPTTEKCGDYFNLINEAHDSTLSEVLIGKEEEYYKEYKKNVEKGIDFRNGSLPRDFELIIPCEASISNTNWLEMRKFEF